ncbi:MAG TPA: hypothetical protein DDW52_15240, partial [Planctomycetaceae bacterium]|nr:hypothetical protein [Planctomycetaceae bacterium]
MSFRPSTFVVFVALLCCTQFSSAGVPRDTSAAEKLEFFETRIRPLLVQHCYECHSAESDSLKASLRVDHRDGLISGGDNGPAIAPGDAGASIFMEAVRYESYEMPPSGKLPDAAIADFEQWINQGAVWPDEEVVAALADEFDLPKRRDEHWAWQPMIDTAPPQVVDTAWPRDPIDQFVLAKLESANLKPAPTADPAVLLRRLHFDLTGLPPTAQEVQEFTENHSERELRRVVDRLLASEQFGERWARHWLDLVRYAESRGHEFDEDARNAFQYRDYVIRALNADVPYDQFLTEHLAGDLLDSPRLNPEHGFNESVLGTGFWFLGEWVHSPVDIRKDEADRFDNMIDVMSKTFLGVTVACARCHDHKFDAISTADYYALSGYLQSSDYHQVRFESQLHNQQVAAQYTAKQHLLQKQFQEILGQELNSLLDASKKQLESAELLDDISEKIVIDYTGIWKQHSTWIQDGFAFGSGPRSIGSVQQVSAKDSWRLTGLPGATYNAMWDVLENESEPPMNTKNKLIAVNQPGRTLRTPTIEFSGRSLSCLVRGEGTVVVCVDSHRLVNGPLHGETIVKFTDADRLQWVDLRLARYSGHRIHLEFTPKQGSELIVCCMASDVTGAQKSAVKDALVQLEASVNDATDRLKANLSAEDAAGIASLIEQWRTAVSHAQNNIRRESDLAMAMRDGTAEDGRILIRGDSGNPGRVVPRSLLTALRSDASVAAHQREHEDAPSSPTQRGSHSVGSGRLELAMKINAPENPLTGRVFVNRVWHHLLGRGIVPTTDDFGVLGERPTHPKLLDYLALHFINDGRSLKRLVRKIVLSQTYRMQGKSPTSEATETDPKNLLWHSRPPRRLQGEAIRDSLFFVAGTLDAAMFGPPVPVHLTEFMQGRGRPSKNGPADGHKRRSIYIAVRRNFLSPFMQTFDRPPPFSSMGRRNVSNVPAQSLILLNDPMVHDVANQWAARFTSLSNDRREQITV